MCNRWQIGAVVFATSIVAVAAGAFGSDPTQNPDKTNGEVRLQHMRRCARDFKFYEGKSSSRSLLIESPILRWSDVARLHSDGTVWAWGRNGRPVFAMEIYTNSYDNEGWICVGHSLTTQPIRIELSDKPDWLSNGPGVEFQQLENLEPPAESAGQRRRQLRALARKLTAHQFWNPDDTRYELRLLTTPLHSYTDDKQHVIDGALFAFVHSTNPEIIVLLEAVEPGAGRRFWQCAFARLGHAAMHVEFDGKPVWNVGRFDKGFEDGGYLALYREGNSGE